MEAEAVKPVAGNSGSPDLAAIPDEQWAVAKRRFEILGPLLEGGAFDAAAIDKRAREASAHRSTLYRWLSAYLKTSNLDALLPRRRGPASGQHRLVPEIEAVIEGSAENRYLTRQRLSPIQTVRDVHLRCREASLKPLSESTVRRRLAEIPAETEIRRREGFLAAQALLALRGSFPDIARHLGPGEGAMPDSVSSAPWQLRRPVAAARGLWSWKPGNRDSTRLPRVNSTFLTTSH